MEGSAARDDQPPVRGSEAESSGHEKDSPPPERGNDPPTDRRASITEEGRDCAPPEERRHPGRDRQGQQRAGRGRRDAADESARYERAWLALSGIDRAPPPVYDGPAHPISGYERLSVERAHTMKDFEKQITELKKENFNLKLRIYFLEEQVQRRCETSVDELQRMNIELRVEVESLKHDYQEKQLLLLRASKAVESLAGEHELLVQRLRQEHLQQLRDAEDAHRRKIHLLEAETAHKKAELEKTCLLLDQERMQSFNAEERLLALNERYAKSVEALEERDWIIQCLNETVHAKDALIAQLQKQIASMMPYDPSDDQTVGHLHPEDGAKDVSPPLEPTCHVDMEDGPQENEWQKKIKEMDDLIHELQQKLQANQAGAAAEEKSALKRDKAIQGLTMALKKKTADNHKLANEIRNLNAALSEAREAAQRAPSQNHKEDPHPDYKKLIFTLQAEQEMYRRLLAYERESGSFQKEMESIAMLRRWLEENIRSNQELRKMMEAQILAKSQGEDSVSCLGDQTSYLSLCLDHQHECLFARGPQAVSESKQLFREDAGTQSAAHLVAAGSPQPDYQSTPSFTERSPTAEETCEYDAKPTRNKPRTVSSAVQTETMAFSDGWTSIDASGFPKETTGLMGSIQNGDLHIPPQRPPQKTSNAFRIPGDVHNVGHSAKKSRLPILLKSSLNTKLKTNTALTLAKGSSHRCLEKESQIQDGRWDEQLRCAEMEAESLNETRDSMYEDGSPHRHDLAEEQMSPIVEGEAELQPAKSKISTLRSKEEMFRSEDSETSNQREPTGRASPKEPQAMNCRLSEQLRRAQVEIERLRVYEDLMKQKGEDLWGSIRKHRESSDDELRAEKLSEELKQAQVEIERLKACEDSVEHKDAVLELSDTVRTESIDKTLQKELQAEHDRLSEQLAQVEIKTLKASEESSRCKNSEEDSKDEQRTPTEQVLQKELRAETSRLSEQLRRAQVEIETLKANEELLKQKYISPSSPSSGDQRVFDGRAQQKELQAENYQLSEELKQAKMEIEKFHAERSSTNNSDDSMKLHGSDADDDLSEQSCLEKTITNSADVNEVDVTSDYGDDVRRSNVSSQNAVALRCHHDSHCTGCANRAITSFPTLDSKRASTIRNSSKFTTVSSSRRSFEDTTSLSKYDLLVQSQARELSLQRRKIKESHNLSIICSKNFYNILKGFDSLFPASALESDVTLGFQEQITQTVEWLKELEYKLGDAVYGEEDSYSDHSVDSLLYTPSRLVPGHRMWADKHGCHVLGLVEDYNALRKQILEARNVLEETEAFIDHGVQTAVLNMTEHFGNIFFEKLSRTKQSLEEAGSLLKLLWRVSLPLQVCSPYTITQDEEANLEINRLRKRVLEQEKLLSGMVKKVYSENQMKEDIEKLILDQLAMTHDILKRAKGNLEVQVVDKLQ